MSENNTEDFVDATTPPDDVSGSDEIGQASDDEDENELSNDTSNNTEQKPFNDKVNSGWLNSLSGIKNILFK